MREIVLFGTGIMAEQFIYEYGDCFDIKYCIDFTPSNKKFLGLYDIYEPTVSNCKGYYIVIAGDYYKSKLIPYFEKMGKNEIDDFIWYEWINKKMVVLNANCYGREIRKYLQNDGEFSKNYFFYPIPPVFENREGTINPKIMRKCDVFIHQDIQVNNKYGYKLSDEYLLKLLEPHTLSITIPNLVGFGKVFFPQSELSNPLSRPFGKSPDGLFMYSDKNIDRLCREGKYLSEIISICRDSEVFTKQELEDNLNQYYLKFKMREKLWDVKILDYIMDFYREKRVFYDPAHPANFIMRKISEDILALLGIHKKLSMYNDGLNQFEVFMYPNVKKNLGISWGGENEILRINSSFKLIKGDMDMEEWIKEYVFWCHPDNYINAR